MNQRASIEEAAGHRIGLRRIGRLEKEDSRDPLLAVEAEEVSASRKFPRRLLNLHSLLAVGGIAVLEADIRPVAGRNLAVVAAVTMSVDALVILHLVVLT